MDNYKSIKDSPKIVIVGHVVIDHNVINGKKYIKRGSPAIFIENYIFKNLGIIPTIISSYGSDFLKYSEDLHLLPTEPNLASTMIYKNVVTHEKRVQYCNYSSDYPPTISNDIKKALGEANIVFVAPLTPNFSTKYIQNTIGLTPENCLKILLPQGYMRQIANNNLVQKRHFTEAEQILKYFDFTILSDEDLLDAKTKAIQWTKLNPACTVVVTENSKGADIITKGKITHVATVPIPDGQIIDSVGSGDTFSAALALSFHEHYDTILAVRAGHLAARRNLTKKH